jgi:hypothetical protein
MAFRIFSLLMTGVLCTGPARADLTLEYKSDVKVGAGMPAAVAEAIKQQMGVSMPPGTTIRIKGEKVLSTSGPLTSIIDYAAAQIAVLHPATKRFASVPISGYAAQMSAAIPEEARNALRDVQIDVKVEKTGKTQQVHGIPAEETLISMVFGLPGPDGQTGQMRMEVRNWMAMAGALERFPELKQWDARKLFESGGFDPLQMMGSAFGQGPAGEKLRVFMRDIAKGSTGLSLRTETRIFMPMVARLLATQGVTTADGPVVEFTLELDQYNAIPIADAVFAVPPDYQAAPLAEILRELNPTKPRVPR